MAQWIRSSHAPGSNLLSRNQGLRPRNTKILRQHPPPDGLLTRHHRHTKPTQRASGLLPPRTELSPPTFQRSPKSRFWPH